MNLIIEMKTFDCNPISRQMKFDKVLLEPSAISSRNGFFFKYFYSDAYDSCLVYYVKRLNLPSKLNIDLQFYIAEGIESILSTAIHFSLYSLIILFAFHAHFAE